MSENERYKCYTHRSCEFFPCHSGADGERFNCLFCYCPLYALGRRCGGDYVYSPDGIKDCSGCLLPHKPESYAFIIGRYEEIMEIVKEQDQT
ncbi:cysteine-rich small domain-containing protein [Synergistaceae bacterium OttesenSCG-928-I11]|nr:cysteine-rich small domain-containing protein [Synergistaceae bacterium OttesenSCG-928-I11]